MSLFLINGITQLSFSGKEFRVWPRPWRRIVMTIIRLDYNIRSNTTWRVAHDGVSTKGCGKLLQADRRDVFLSFSFQREMWNESSDDRCTYWRVEHWSCRKRPPHCLLLLSVYIPSSTPHYGESRAATAGEPSHSVDVTVQLRSERAPAGNVERRRMI